MRVDLWYIYDKIYCRQPKQKPSENFVLKYGAERQKNMGDKNKKIITVVLLMVFAASTMTACHPAVNAPCMYCGSKPSKQYNRSNGSYMYACANCTSECMICHRKKPTTHIEIEQLGTGQVDDVFICDDCH